MTQEKLPHRKELCLQSVRGACAPLFIFFLYSPVDDLLYYIRVTVRLYFAYGFSSITYTGIFFT